MHRQQSPPWLSSTGRETPVSGKDATTTAKMASFGLFFIDGLNRPISQSRELTRCILRPFDPSCQITVVMKPHRFYAQPIGSVSGFHLMAVLSPFALPSTKSSSSTISRMSNLWTVASLSLAPSLARSLSPPEWDFIFSSDGHAPLPLEHHLHPPKRPRNIFSIPM